MTKIIHRPDPPTDTTGNRRVQRTSQVQNDQAHARLFERALVRASSERQTEIKTTEKALDKQHLIDRDNDVEASVQKVSAISSTLADSEVSTEQVSDEMLADEATDQNTTDEDTGEVSNDLFFLPNTVFTPSHQGAETFQSEHAVADGSNSPEKTVHSTAEQTTAVPLNQSQGQSDAVAARLADLPSLYELLQSDSELSAHKEWHFTFEDDEPVSELTLARKDNGQWHVGVTAINTPGDSSLFDALQQRLEGVGLPVASVSITEKDKLA